MPATFTAKGVPMCCGQVLSRTQTGGQCMVCCNTYEVSDLPGGRPPMVCSCFNGYALDDCDRRTPCTRCSPKTAPAPEKKQFWEGRAEFDQDTFGRSLRVGS